MAALRPWFGDRVNVVSVETEGTNTLARSLEEGPDIDVSASGVAAGSLGGPALGKVSYEVIKDRVKTALVLSDADVYDAAQKLWETTRLVGEPGGRCCARRFDLGRLCPGQGVSGFAFFFAAATPMWTGSRARGIHHSI